jgi:hypothetical protein
MHFNSHGGRSGVRSAAKHADRLIRHQAQQMATIRPGPPGMGLVSPAKPNAIPQLPGSQERQKYSHLHQIHEKYNERG